MKEAHITINWHHLTFAESMTLRVAISSFLMNMKEEGLGDDKIGKSLAQNYTKNASNIQNYIMEEAR